MKPATEIIEALRKELSLTLPGEDAQYRMAPPYRPRLTKQDIQALNPRVSGVMVLLYEKENALHLVFTQRHTSRASEPAIFSITSFKPFTRDAFISLKK